MAATYLGYSMANFSVEWLSKSYYEEVTISTEVQRELEGFSQAPSLQQSPTSPNSKLNKLVSTSCSLAVTNSEHLS